VLDCEEYEVGFIFLNSKDREEIEVEISVVKIY
jgi:hypothetical protein